MPFLIGLTGYAGSGKDSVRDILETDHEFTGLAFAEPIRAMICELLTSNGIGSEWMYERTLKEQVIPQLGVSYRHMAQTLGTEWGRNLQTDFWLRIAQAYMEDLSNHGHLHFVVSDVRFVNEAEWVKKQGGVIWHIRRPDVAPVRPHASEAEIEHIEADWTINNTGSLDDLKPTVLEALRTLA